MGYKLAGFEVLGCNEIDPRMMDLYKHNHHPKYTFECDVRDLLKMDLPEELYNLDILDGSPPCSVFSIAGRREQGWNKEKKFREGQKKQKLDDLFFAFIDVAKELRPKVVIAENVRGLIGGNAKGYVREIFAAFADAGYDVQLFLLNAARMGVPQARERVFFIGRRKDLQLPEVKLNFQEPVITFGEVREAKGKTPGGELAEIIKFRQRGDRDCADVNKRVTKKASRFTSPILYDEEVCRTIVSSGEMVRFYDGDKLSDGDIINVQTFPQDYDFLKQSVQYVCGMSVPPVMMANLAAEIFAQLF